MIHGGACRCGSERTQDHKRADADIIRMDGGGMRRGASGVARMTQYRRQGEPS